MKSQELNQFDRLAPFYDSLANAAYGSSIRRAQTSFLDGISPGSSVLVIGGGTGWWLQDLLCKTPDLRIWFVDASERMIAGARRQTDDYRVTYIHGTVEDIPAQMTFDVVITHFFLDMFSNHTLKKIVQRIAAQLGPGGQWLAADFVNKKWWHAPLLKVMYLFFWMTCRLSTQSLPQWKEVLEGENLKCIRENMFYGKFISSCSFVAVKQAAGCGPLAVTTSVQHS